MLRNLWLEPPLAFARLGGSPTPLEAFSWGPNDNSPLGTGKTTIVPEQTLAIANDGTITCHRPTAILFKDEHGFRPVCPFFELHGAYGEPATEVTPAVLKRFGLDVSRLLWRIEVANLKPYFMTRDWQTRIEASVDLRGVDVAPQRLRGTAPSGAPNPLVPPGRHVPLGAVQLSRPSTQDEVFRLRFTPGRGRFFGPENLHERWAVTIPKEDLFLNPRSSWCTWVPGPEDPRGKPEGQYAKDQGDVSLGLVDDICDGIICCWIEALPEIEPAYARIVVAPPDYAPDRRPIVSLADGLKDRVDRSRVHAPGYVDAPDTDGEIVDLLERTLETMGLMNLDALNDRMHVQENRDTAVARGVPYDETKNRPFPASWPMPGDPLPLTARGRELHRRLVVPETLMDFIRKRPKFVEQWVRQPLDPNPLFDSRMPALMRGAAGHPHHLTRRQYDLLRLWVKRMVGESKGDRT